MRKSFFALIAPALILISCNSGTQSQPAEQAAATLTPAQQTQISDFVPSVAYIDVDSLMMQYDLAVELRNSFQTKYTKAERDLNAKMSKFEKDLMDAQEKIQKGLVTRAQAAELEQGLAAQQQDIMQNRDARMAELSEEEQVMNNRLFYAVSDFLKEFNADYRYSMIISTTASGPILHANPSLNITGEVLAALNQRYAAEQAQKKR